MENRVYLITGASSEVGKTLINRICEENSDNEKNIKIYAGYSTHGEALQKLQAEERRAEIIPVQADLSKEEEILKITAALKEAGDCPDYFIHLPAAKLTYNKLKKADWSAVSKDMELQVHSLLTLGQNILPGMAKRGSGKVVVMLSAVTLGMPPKFMSQYVVTKYALLGLMKSMAMEYADKGICVNGISPNMMETPFLSEIDERIVEMNRESCTLKRNVKVEETVEAIRFLLSDSMGYMNGVNLNLTGGDR